MTTITAESSAIRAGSADATALRRLRMVLTVNAITSFAGGAVGLAAAPWVSQELGFDHVALTRIVSIGLMLFAVDVALLARTRAEHTIRWSAAVSAADLVWVAATIVLVAGGTLTTAGVVVATVLGLGVLDFAVLQLWLRGRAA